MMLVIVTMMVIMTMMVMVIVMTMKIMTMTMTITMAVMLMVMSRRTFSHNRDDNLKPDIIGSISFFSKPKNRRSYLAIFPIAQ